MFISKSAEHKELKNNILALASEANKAKKKDSSVINATTGMLKNEDGSLYEFESVKSAIKDLNVSEKFAYVNSTGTPKYAEAVLLSIFGKYLEEVKKECYIDCLATPGGSGALNLTFTNYVERGETVLLPNHMWENYLSYGVEMGFNSATYSLFDENGNFDIEDLKHKVTNLKHTQNKILILINDPCENPTGFCMKEKDYDALINIARDNPNTNFIYLMDVAYFDFYNVDSNIIKKRYAKFKDIPSNALALFVFSGSKSFGLYGLRIGALCALSKDEEEIKDFKRVSSFSCRAKWSSSSTLGMSIIEKLVLNEEYISSYEEEIKTVCAMLEERSIAFLKAAKEVGLETLPYEKGFFICVPSKDPERLMNELQKDGVYAISTHSALRIALCAINKSEASRLPKLIKSRID